MRRILRDRPIAESATTAIRTAILTGELRPGTRIRQEELADRLAVSRAPIRQALAVLKGEGLLHTDRGRGTVVAPLDATLIRDLYELRGVVERFVAATLAQRNDFAPEQSRAIVKAGYQAASGANLRRLTELDLQFHTGLYDAVGNQVLSDVMREQWVHFRRVMAATLAISGYPQQVWDEHTAILEAIESHDPERAGTLAAEHTHAASVRLTKVFESLNLEIK